MRSCVNRRYCFNWNEFSTLKMTAERQDCKLRFNRERFSTLAQTEQVKEREKKWKDEVIFEINISIIQSDAVFDDFANMEMKEIKKKKNK